MSGMLSDAEFLAWGWRVAFWLSAVIVIVGYYIRTKVTEAPIFLEAQAESAKVKSTSYGVVEVMKRYPRGVFTAMGLRVAENIIYYVVVAFSITYLKTVHDFDVTTVLGLLILAHAFHFVVIPFYGRLSDTHRPPAGLHGRCRAVGRTGPSSPSRCSTRRTRSSSWPRSSWALACMV